MYTRKVFSIFVSLFMFLGLCIDAMAFSSPIDAEMANAQYDYSHDLGGPVPVELRNQIRREKFDLILPQAMRKNNVDMWIHVMRDAIPDRFGREELGSESGLFVFTDRGGDRIERAVLGRRWGATQRQRGEGTTNLLEESGAYDIIHDPVFVVEPVSSPMTEYDYRFKGLREFVEARDPQRIAVNFNKTLGPWPTTRRTIDGISHTDYLLLTAELGEKYNDRLVSSEYVLLDFISSPVPVEVEKWKRERSEQNKAVKKAIAEIVPGETKRREARTTVFRRTVTGESQRGRSDEFGSDKVERGDIVASPSQGMYAYVLHEGEKEPPPEIKRLYAEYLKIDKILTETIKAGLTPREIIQNYKKKFEDARIVVVDPQMHMVQPKNNFPVYSMGYDPGKTLLSIDCHPIYTTQFSPRVGSYGPDWTYDIPLKPNHHFVLEYFFYMPSPTPNKDEDQYLFFWDHEQAVATENGVEYLTKLKKELYLIK